MKTNALKAVLATTSLATGLALLISATAGAAQADDWNGSYAGVQLSFSEDDTGSVGSTRAAGIQAGRDWQFGNWVVGVGADILRANGIASTNEFESISRAKIRGGYDFGGTMAFVSVGASYASHYDFGNDWGYSAGVGIEHKLNGNWSVSGELVQHRFDDFNGVGKMEPTSVSLGMNYRF